MRLPNCGSISLCLSWMMELGSEQDLVGVEAEKNVCSHCTSFFLRPDDDNPRVNAGHASLTTVDTS